MCTSIIESNLRHSDSVARFGPRARSRHGALLPVLGIERVDRVAEVRTSTLLVPGRPEYHAGMTLHRGAIVGAGLLLVLVVAACSGDGKNKGGADSGASGTTGGSAGEATDRGTGGSETATSLGSGGEGTGGTGGSGGAGDSGGSGGASGSGSGGVAASGGSGGTGGAGGTGGEGGCSSDCVDSLPLDEFCDGFADSVCDHLQRCLDFADREACEAWPRWPTMLLTCSTGVEAVEAGRLSYDPVVGAQCLAAQNDPDCGYAVPVVRAGMGVGPCAGVFVGEVEVGGDCYPASTAVSDECAPGGYCVGQCPGECVAVTPPGDDCEDDTECGVGAYCDSVCKDLPGVGEECDSRCEFGLSCLTVTGTCATLREPGEECVEGSDCVSGYCEDDACLALPGDGEDCFEYDQCAAGLACVDGTCYEAVETGEVCNGDANCPEGERCLNDQQGEYVCRAPGQIGEFCSTDRDCDSPLICNWDVNECSEQGEKDDPCAPLIPQTCGEDLFCDRETVTCQAPVGEGEPCNPTAGSPSCVEGFYCECTDAPGCSSISSAPNDYDICVAQKDDGEECSRATECSSGACLDTLDGPICADPGDVELTACAGPS